MNEPRDTFVLIATSASDDEAYRLVTVINDAAAVPFESSEILRVGIIPLRPATSRMLDLLTHVLDDRPLTFDEGVELRALLAASIRID